MQTACGINPDNKIQCFGTDDVTGDTPDTLRQGQASPPDGKYTQVGLEDTLQLITSSSVFWCFEHPGALSFQCLSSQIPVS